MAFGSLLLLWIALSPTVVYAQGPTPQGQLDDAPGSGAPNGVIQALLILPGDDDLILAGTRDGLYVGLDAGRTWQAVTCDNLPLGNVQALLLAGPVGQQRLLVGSDRGLFQSNSVFEGWTRRDVIAGSDQVIALSARKEGFAYLATETSFLYSADGDNWQRGGEGLPSGVSALAIHPQHASLLYAGTGDGVFVSSDGGQHWYAARTGLPAGADIVALALAPTDAQQIVALAEDGSLFFSKDGGAQWRALSATDLSEGLYEGMLDPHWLGCHAGTGFGQLAAHLLGASGWPPGKPEATLLTLATDPQDFRRVYAGTSRGIYVSTGGGSDWRELADELVRNTPERAPLATSSSESITGRWIYWAGGVGLALLTVLGIWGLQYKIMPRLAAKSPPAWEAVIASALADYHYVEADMLEGIPPLARGHAMARYVSTHRELALTYRDYPPSIVPEREEELKGFREAWFDLVQSDADVDTRRAALALIESLVTLLNMSLVRHREREKMLGYMLRASSIRLGLPERLPLILVRSRCVEEDTMRAIRRTLGDLNADVFFALLVTVGKPSDSQRKADQLKRIVHSEASDFIVLDYRALSHLFLAADSQGRLVDSVLEQTDLTVVSPYVTSGPVPENMFFGRDYELKVIMRTIEDTSFALVGGRKIGKTSILSKVQRLLRYRDGFSPIFLDCHHIRDYAGFYEALSVTAGVETSAASPSSLRRLLLPLRQRQETNSTLVFLLDEVDSLLQYDIEHDTLLFGVFRSLSQEGACRFVFCGERTFEAALSDPTSPLFNFCTVLRLRYLRRTDVERIVVDPMHEMGISLEERDEVVEKVIAFSSCHPNLVQTLCQMLIMRLNERGDRTIQPADIEAVGLSAEYREAFFEIIWGSATPLERLISVLAAEETLFAAPMVYDWLRDHGLQVSREKIKRALDGLVLYAILQQTAEGYQFSMRAFPAMLRRSGLAATYIEGLTTQIDPSVETS